MRRSLALAGVTTLAMAGFAFGAGPALAADPPPVVGTADCLQAVEGVGTVAQARDNLAAAQSTLSDKQSTLETAQSALDSAKAERKAAQVAVTDLQNQIDAAKAADPSADTSTLESQLGIARNTLADKQAAVRTAQAAVDDAQAAVNDAQTKVDTAQSLLAQARVAATAQVCTGTTEEETTAPPPGESTTPAPPAVQPGAIVTDPADDEDCVNFPTQALAQAHLEADPTDPDHLDADHDGQACEDFFAAAPGSTTVNNSTTEINNGTLVSPLVDDGSTATTSGNEVTDVPQGSVQTGAA